MFHLNIAEAKDTHWKIEISLSMVMKSFALSAKTGQGNRRLLNY